MANMVLTVQWQGRQYQAPVTLLTKRRLVLPTKVVLEVDVESGDQVTGLRPFAHELHNYDPGYIAMKCNACIATEVPTPPAEEPKVH